MSAPTKPDGRRKAPTYGVRIRFVPAPKGHDFDAGFDALAAIGRRVIAGRTPTRAGLWIIAYLLFVTFYLFPAALCALRPAPKTIAQVETRWHGPCHEFPQEYAR